MSSEEISLNGLNSQLVFQDDPLRSFGCHQHHHHHRGVGGGGGDPGPKTRELTGFIDDKIFSSVDRDRYFRPQSAIFADHHPDRHLIPVGDKMGNGKAKQLSNSFGKNGNVMQTVNINNGALVTVAEADGDMYYSQYMQGTTEGSSGSGQKECVVVDNGCGISGSAEVSCVILNCGVAKLIMILDSVPAAMREMGMMGGTLMDDAMILPCGHTFGAAGIQHISRTKACFTCTRPVSEDSIAPNLSLRAAVQAFRREEELQYYRSCKRRRERFDQDKGSFGDSTLNDLPRGRGVQFPFAVTDRVIIKGNKRTPQRFVGREAVVTTQCLNGWYVVKTLDNAESVKLQYRSLAKVPDDPSSKPTVTKMPPNWL
ncbi:hypothetical protein EZV62_025841 [Acer yangbiense]|uniref:PUB 62/63 C-terminal domain-containing protein n=1 Tax=Acer yangbiense TaxID=1000413 RepID=A0A5C7H106_9ROSI|nr:hypothetical protein EZV62_025841 [Acer yangbiense]